MEQQTVKIKISKYYNVFNLKQSQNLNNKVATTARKQKAYIMYVKSNCGVDKQYISEMPNRKILK